MTEPATRAAVGNHSNKAGRERRKRRGDRTATVESPPGPNHRRENRAEFIGVNRTRKYSVPK